MESWIQRQGGQAAETPKPLRSPPFHAAGNLHPPGRGVRKSPSGRYCHLLPGTPRSALGPYDPEVSGAPASRLPRPLFVPAGRLGRGGPQPKPGREAGAGELRRLQPRWGRAQGTVGGRGPGGRPRATHASNLLFILSPPPSPLPHGVTSAPPGPLPLRARSLPAAHGAAERLRAGPVWDKYPGTPGLGGCAEAVASRSLRAAGLGATWVPVALLPAFPAAPRKQFPSERGSRPPPAAAGRKRQSRVADCAGSGLPASYKSRLHALCRLHHPGLCFNFPETVSSSVLSILYYSTCLFVLPCGSDGIISARR